MQPPITTPPTATRHRPEIQALRALAVSVVVVYHLWPGALPGGYVGVDVFFVISGFLITGQLLAEAERTGRVRLGRFWARRLKRLVPASSIVLLTTTVGVLVFVPLALWRQFLGEVIASALQVENWRLAHDAVDYLAVTDNSRSPVQHYWSLAVEEQCYVVVPLLLCLLALATRRRPALRTPSVLAVLGLAAALSLAWSIHRTATDPGVAYFSTLTRAWEFGCGALLAAWPARRAGRTHRLLPWLGVAAVLTACVRYDDGLAFPGALAAVPVLGATLAIATGRGTALARFGSWGPVALLGRVSYAAYLWHLPLLVLAPYAAGRALHPADKVLVLVATGALAVASTFVVEEPVRFRARLLGARRPVTVVVVCAAAVAAVIGVASTGLDREQQRARQLAVEAQELLVEQPPCLGAQAMDPALAPCPAPEAAGVVVPDPVNARRDDANRPECWNTTDGTPHVCRVGTLTGHTRRLLAVGDSHNNTLLDVYDTLGRHRGWRIDVTGKGSCYLTDAEQAAPSTDLAADCREWRRRVLVLARTGGYAAVLVTHSTHNRPIVVPTGSTVLDATVDGLVSAWRRLPGVPVIAIRDNPRPRDDVVACVGAHRREAATRCARTRAAALADPEGQAEAVRQVRRARLVDLTDYYCNATTCPPVIGNVLVYRDGTHLTKTYADTLEPYLERQVVAALGWPTDGSDGTFAGLERSNFRESPVATPHPTRATPRLRWRHD